MYSYSGWNAAAYIVEEIRDPAKSLPRALIFGTLFVLALYVTVNCVFLYTTPLSALSGAPEVAHIAGVQIFGPIGARIGSALICVGLVANVSAMIWVGSRVSQAIGATYPALGLFGRTNQRRVPTVALLYQYGIVFFLLFFDPNKIIHYIESVFLFWLLLAVLGVIVLRWREPNLARPYRTFGYPVTPLIFAVVTIFCLVQNCQIYPTESAIGTATVLIGIPLYWWARRALPGHTFREPLPPALRPKRPPEIYSMTRFSLLARSVVSLLVLAAATAQALDLPYVPPTPLSPDRWYNVNSSARSLAGEYAPKDQGAHLWESSSAWNDYREYLAGRWSYLDRVRLNAMRSWSARELSSLRSQTPTLFYPFSGPDFLYADTFFPDAKYVVMAGLEPIGSMPDLGELEQSGQLGAYLQQVKTSLFTILAASFFKTKDMRNDFSRGAVDGLMPALVVFLAHEGYTIDSIHYVTLTSAGTLEEHAGKGGANGVQITYFGASGRGDMRVLTYFSIDLSNEGTPGFVALMSRLGPGITYLKAASYLLYNDYFSRVRNGILQHSLAVVEDDSGMPLHDFSPAAWDVQTYGNYTGPIALFKEFYQPDLTQYYVTHPPAPLPFGSGYKYVASTSSLLVAVKRSTPSAVPLIRTTSIVSPEKH